MTTGQLRTAGSVAGGLGVGSPHDMLVHIVGAEEIWLRRWQGQQRTTLPGGNDFADLRTTEERWWAVERGRFAFLDSVAEDDLDRDVNYISISRGVEERFPLWQTMLHVTNHTTHHRAEVCTALTALGHPAESVDLIDYLRASRDR
jgi:uncharacterized damage-inducible protein DinB